MNQWGDGGEGGTGTMMPAETLSVAGLTAYLQDLLTQDPVLMRVWVVGEVSSASDRNGHLFFTLQDTEGSESMAAVVWRSQRSRLGVDPTPGEQVLALGKVSLYTQRSAYQLVVWQLLPVGAGLQGLRRQQLRDRLQAEGLFDPDQKQPLPTYPHTIAVVTSPQAAAWGDIQRTLRQRHPGLRVLLAPTLVQGEQAPRAIALALERVVADGRAQVVIVARGGGAREDLDCFDHEQVVRAIFTCPIPVITGIGHQRDECLADWVADQCAHTPTAAAEQAVPALGDLWQAHCQRRQRLQAALGESIAQRRDRLVSLRRRLEYLRLDQALEQERQQVDWLRQRWINQVRHQLDLAHHQCQALGQALHSLDPAAVLRRGYALVRQQGETRVVARADQVQPGETLHIQLGTGSLTATVQTVAPESDA